MQQATIEKEKKMDGVGFYSNLITSLDMMSRANVPISSINEFCILSGLSDKEINGIYDFVTFYQLIRKTITHNIVEAQKKEP